MLSATILNDLKTKNYCRIQGPIRLTKTIENYSDVLILRNRDLEKQTLRWIQERTQTEELFFRYKEYDSSLNDFSLPQHYPVQIISGVGSACSGKNIFMFFPFALNQKPESEADVFGLEFIDVWRNIFQTVVLPIAHRVFTKDTLVSLLSLQKNLEKTIFLSSVFHEVGHRCGPYKVSPQLSAKLKLNDFQVDVMGELSTDSLLIKNLSEFPEVLQFILLQRLFWFGRKGFRHNPISADLNSDNDCWIGSMLWQSLLKKRVIIQQGLRYHISFRRARKFFESLVDEIDSLGLENHGELEQEKILSTWMNRKVPNKNDVFTLPDGFKRIFQENQDIPEVPHFQTIYPYNLINELTGAMQNEK